MKKNLDPKQLQRRLKRMTAVYLTVFLAIILLISLYINQNSFQSQYEANELSFYSVSGSRLVSEIENGLQFGKDIKNYYGLESMLQEWANNNTNVLKISILSPDRSIAYASLELKPTSESTWIDDSIQLEIYDRNDNLAGYVKITLDLSYADKTLQDRNRVFFIGTAVLFLLGTVIVGFTVASKYLFKDDGILNRRRLLLFTLMLTLILQSAFTIYAYQTLRGFFVQVAQNTVDEIGMLVQSDIDQVIAKGVRYDQIYAFDDYARDVVDRAPALESIKLEGDRLVITASDYYVRQAVSQMLLNMLTILAASLFIAAEAINLILISINRYTEQISHQKAYDRLPVIRSTSFLIHAACYLPVSFIPILMNQLVGGGASDLFLGLPVMVFFAAGLVFTLLAGSWSSRYGWKQILLLGVLLLIASSLAAGLIRSAAVLVLARGVYGAAYALIYVSIREFAAMGQDRASRSAGLAQVTAGLYAGCNIGAVIGAMIVERAGFAAVFVLSAILGGASIFLVKRYCIVESFTLEPAEAIPAAPASKTAGHAGGQPPLQADPGMVASWKKAMQSHDLLRLAALIIAPLAISSVYFDYFLPVYAVKESISTADVGRAFLLNGIAVAYAAPLLLKQIGSKWKESTVLFGSVTLMAGGFLLFGLWGGIGAMLLSAIIMGIAEGIALVSQNMIMLDFTVVKQIGTSRMLSIYATIRKLAQTIAPQIFALYMLAGYRAGMAYFGGTLFFLNVANGLAGRQSGKAAAAPERIVSRNSSSILETGTLHNLRTGQDETFTMRYLTLEDVPDMIKLQERVFAVEDFDPSWLSRTSRNEFEEIILAEDNLAIGVYTDTLLVGLRMASGSGWEFDEIVRAAGDEYLEKFCFLMNGSLVDPDYRGNNLQQRMSQYVIDDWKARGVKAFLVTVHPDNLPSIKSLNNLGFLMKTRAMIYHGKYDRLIMVKEDPR